MFTAKRRFGNVETIRFSWKLLELVPKMVNESCQIESGMCLVKCVKPVVGESMYL